MGELYDVELYRLTHYGNPGDVSYYRAACKGAKHILELGCGFGRVLLPLVRAGYSVTGIDLHPGMLAALQTEIAKESQLQSSSISLIEADMRSFELSTRFDRIILPFNGLYCMNEKADISACLHQIRKHLRPNGVFLFDIHILDLDELEYLNSEEWEFLATTYAKDGRRIDIFERRIWQLETQQVVAIYRYVIGQGKHSQEQIYDIPQCYLTPEQCAQLLRDAGFRISQIYGDFYGSAFDQYSPHMVVWAKIN